MAEVEAEVEFICYECGAYYEAPDWTEECPECGSHHVDKTNTDPDR